MILLGLMLTNLLISTDPLVPSIEAPLVVIDTNCPNVDCNYTNASGDCITQQCAPPPAYLTLSWSMSTNEPSTQTEVWHSTDLRQWNIVALVNGTTFTATNNWTKDYFRIRCTCPGFISAWNTQ